MLNGRNDVSICMLFSENEAIWENTKYFIQAESFCWIISVLFKFAKISSDYVVSVINGQK